MTEPFTDQSGRRLATIEFQGHQLLTIHDGEREWTAAKPICDALGVSWQGQSEKLKSDPILAEGIKIILIPSAGGSQETTMIAVELVQAWLMGISDTKVKPEARPALLAFKRECARVLHDYWVKGAAHNPRFRRPDEVYPGLTAREHKARLSDQTQMMAILNQMRAPQSAADRAARLEALNEILKRLGYPLMTQADFGPQHVPVDPRAVAFFDVVDRLEALGEPVNQSRRKGRLAVSLKHLKRLATRHGLHLDLGTEARRALKAHPRYLDATSVNSPDGKSIHCLLFRAD